MSNADDRCVFVDSDGQCKYLRGNHWYVDGWHAFVESAPQPAPSGDEAFCKFIDGKMVECDGYGNEPGWRERSQHGESVPIPPGPTFRLTEAQCAQLIANHQPASSGDAATYTDGEQRPARQLNEERLIRATPVRPSGDEAKVREIANAADIGVIVTRLGGSNRQLDEVYDLLDKLQKQAYAAGKADGRREAEDGYLIDIRQARWGHGDNDAIDDELVRLHNLIIARRGSEGK